MIFLYRWLILAQVQVSPSELNKLPQGNVTRDTFVHALQLVFGVLGGIALLIVTVAGFQYVVSQGDPQATAKAKNTIIDALIGLAISLLAFSIVSFVFKYL